MARRRSRSRCLHQLGEFPLWPPHLLMYHLHIRRSYLGPARLSDFAPAHHTMLVYPHSSFTNSRSRAVSRSVRLSLFPLRVDQQHVHLPVVPEPVVNHPNPSALTMPKQRVAQLTTSAPTIDDVAPFGVLHHVPVTRNLSLPDERQTRLSFTEPRFNAGRTCRMFIPIAAYSLMFSPVCDCCAWRIVVCLRHLLPIVALYRRSSTTITTQLATFVDGSHRHHSAQVFPVSRKDTGRISIDRRIVRQNGSGDHHGNAARVAFCWDHGRVHRGRRGAGAGVRNSRRDPARTGLRRSVLVGR